VVASKVVIMVTWLLGLAIGKTLPDPSSFVTRHEYRQVHMGVEFRLTIYTSSAEKAAQSAQLCFSEIRSLDETLSDYQQKSELNTVLRKAHDQPAICSPTLFELCQASQQISVATKGFFDATVGSLTKLWRETRKAGHLPPLDQLIEAKSRCGWDKIRLDPSRRTLTLTDKWSTLDFGGIAKGFACDRVISILKENGIQSALIEAGGDLACVGTPPGRSGWEIEIQGGPKVLLRDQAMSTSGSTSQFIEIEGRRYSHILDPRTGLGVNHQRQVTVFAARGIDTDPWATALCINPHLRFPKHFKVIILDGEN
jgi:FAD:protein FMN transferase